MAVLEERYTNRLDTLGHAWGWMVTMGIVSMILGLLAIGTSVVVSYATVAVLGFLLLIGGLFTAIHSFWTRQWAGFFLHFFGGILMLVLGAVFITNPTLSLASLTLLLAFYFVAIGIIRSIQAVAMRYNNWGWGLLSGLVTLALGVLIWTQWPTASLFILGLFIGIDLLFLGMSWLMLGIGVHRLGRRLHA